MKKPHNIETLEELVSRLFPNGCVESDNDGQLLIYTGLQGEDDGSLADWDADEDRPI